MKHLKFEGANALLGRPENWDEEKDGPCDEIYAQRVDGTYRTLWAPTPDELEVLKNGGGIVLTFHSNYFPPTSMTVAEVNYTEEPLVQDHGGEPVEEGDVTPYDEQKGTDPDDSGTRH